MRRPAIVFLRLAVVAPVVHALEQHLAPAERKLDVGVAVPAASFQTRTLTSRSSVSRFAERTSGGAGADNDVVVGLAGLCHAERPELPRRRRTAALRLRSAAPVTPPKPARSASRRSRRRMPAAHRSPSASATVRQSRLLDREFQATLHDRRQADVRDCQTIERKPGFRRRMCPSRIFSWATKSALCAGKSALRSAAGFLASLNTAT